MLPTVTGFAARAAIEALRKRGVRIDPLLHRVGLSERDLVGDDNSGRVTAIAQARLLDLAAEATGDSVFGLHLAEQSDARDAGIFFYVASGAENFGEALTLFARYFRIVNEAVRLKLTRPGERLIAEVEFVGLPRHEVRQNAEFGIAAIVKALREVAGRTSAPPERYLRTPAIQSCESSIASTSALSSSVAPRARAYHPTCWSFPAKRSPRRSSLPTRSCSTRFDPTAIWRQRNAAPPRAPSDLRSKAKWRSYYRTARPRQKQ
jgi:hypothetical protein